MRLSLACCLFLWAFSSLAATPHETLAALIEKSWQHDLETHPEFATSVGDNRYNDRLSDLSPAAVAREVDYESTLLASLEKIDSSQLSSADRLNQSLLIRSLKIEIAGARFKHWEMPVTQFGGPHLNYAGMAKNVPLKTVQDYRNYLSRLQKLPAALAQVTSNMRLGMRDGLMPPQYLLAKIAEEADEVAAKPMDQSLFTDPIRKFPDAVPLADRARLTKAINETVRDQVLPAFAAFAKFVKTEYEPKGRAEYGIWALPDGEARYAHAIEELTTTQSNPEELHALGLKQVAEIEERMLAIAKKEGFADIKSFNAHIFADKQHYGVSAQQIFDLYQRYTNQMYAKLPAIFWPPAEGQTRSGADGSVPRSAWHTRRLFTRLR